jgi:Ca2+-binding RTX toxin-like protein
MAKNSRGQARSVVKPANILPTKSTSAATKVVRHGIEPDTTDVWTSTNDQPPGQYDDNLVGYFLPFARPTSVDLVPPTWPTPSQLTRPATGVASIAPVAGTLTQGLYLQEPGDPAAISVYDINQGQMGDCFLLASIGELALFDPSWITQMIHANTDGTETVTLYRAANGSLPNYGATSYAPAAINVTNTFPSNAVNGYSSRGVYNGQQEIWVQVLEKAVATTWGGYSAISNGGSPSIVMEELTGCSGNYILSSSLSLQQLQTAVTAGELIVFDTQTSGSLGYGLYNQHAYMFQSLTTVNGTVMVNLLNPWGSYEPAPVPFAKVGSLFNAIEFDQFTRAGVNLGPILVRQTAGQTWTQGSHVSLALGADVFIEASGKTLSYAAAQANGQALPSWLTFNAATTTFSGTVPGWMQTLSLKVTATDTSALSCSETFQAASDGSGFAATDMSAGAPVSDSPQAYSGPVPGLQSEYISITADNLNISVSTPNWFIHSGSGDDAIAVNGGTNVLDGGTGSNFLTGGSGTDTFFVDDGGPTADIWSTVVGFHAGDAATIWGVTPQDFSISWMDGQGATGCTGLTLHAAAAGRPTASLTLAGFSQADMRSGRLSVGFGSDPASGSAYMYVHGNS